MEKARQHTSALSSKRALRLLPAGSCGGLAVGGKIPPPKIQFFVKQGVQPWNGNNKIKARQLPAGAKRK
jgi:hypothetical protein